MNAPDGTDPIRDRGAAFERTSLAWNRTGLSAVAVGALTLHVFQDRGLAGFLLAVLLVVGGALAYLSARRSPVSPARLRLLSLVVTGAAVLGGLLSATEA